MRSRQPRGSWPSRTGPIRCRPPRAERRGPCGPDGGLEGLGPVRSFEIDALLRGERPREGLRRERAARDQHLTEPASIAVLLGERVPQLVSSKEPCLDEQPAERPPRRRTGGRRLELAGRVEVDAVLLREHPRERPAAQVPVVDEDLAQRATAALLLLERVLELLRGEESFVRKQRPERTPRETRLVHRWLYRHGRPRAEYAWRVSR
jgi:hypothetical protein